MHKQMLVPAVTACALLASGMAVKAADELNKGWAYEITPYLWAVNIDGDVKVDGESVSVDVDFDDLVKDVEIGGSLLGVVRKDRYVVWTQLDYFELSSDDLDGAPPDTKLDMDVLFLEAAVGYQFSGPFEGSTIDAMIGARYASFDTTLHIQGQRGTANQDFLDPMLVVRPYVPIRDWVAFNPTLAIGGGGDSDLIYELQPQFQFRLTETLHARVGYRRVYYDAEGKRGNEFDGSFDGLIAGLGFIF